MFKADWEKTSISHQLPEGMVEKIVLLAYPNKKLISDELIVGGCANLNFKIQLENEKHPLILRVYLRDKDAASREQKLIAKISQDLDRYGHVFPDKNEKHLVHADFDPANILVHRVDNVWKVSGVLDWEFAFSGSVLCDVANMLRYAHKMPHEFQDAFLKGLADGGVALPKNWYVTIQLLNLLSLLDCLKRSAPKNRPSQCADICELINHILS